MDVGFNFRGTAGYVTDPAGTYRVLYNDAYPYTYATGVVGGWTDTGESGADRSVSVDARLAGVCYGAAGAAAWRFDLPTAGTYQIGLAFGDNGSSQSGSTLVVKDNTTTVLTIGPHNLTANSFYDGANAQYSAANWPASNSLSAPLVFATTTLTLVLTADANPVIAHLRVVSVGSSRPKGRITLLGAGR